MLPAQCWWQPMFLLHIAMRCLLRCWHSLFQSQSCMRLLGQVQYLEPTPPSEDLMLISTVTHIEGYKDNPSRRDSVQVDLQLCKVS